MRLNKFLASHSSLSRRGADEAIAAGRVRLNGHVAALGDTIDSSDTVTLDGNTVLADTAPATLILHKPVSYVCSRAGQGSRTVYDLLPRELHQLNPVGRLDKDSSGLLLMTSDGDLAHHLTHPRYQKAKVYEVSLSRALTPSHQQRICEQGVQLEDGLSRLSLEKSDDTAHKWQVTMHEGRNRQIRRTFAALGYTVVTLHRTSFGDYRLDGLTPSSYKLL